MFKWLLLMIFTVSLGLSVTQQSRYQDLLSKYRCLVCQNQTLLDSDASFARDLRQKIYLQIVNNKSDIEIDNYLVDLYGESIRVIPDKANHLLLWLAPVWILVLLLTVIFNWQNNTRRS